MADFQEVERSAKAIIENATEMYRRDRRIAMLVDGSVVAARGEMGRYIDPEDADRDAHDLAIRACAILASRIFTEDAELHALRQERDHYKRLALEGLALTPPRPFVVLKTDAEPA